MMKTHFGTIETVVCLAFVVAGTLTCAVEIPEGAPYIDGVLGLETADGHGWLAIKVDFAETHALSGVLWYNNDREAAFPTVVVGTGYDSGPETVETCVPVAMSVYGVSEGWSECTFSEPIAATLGGLYVIFEFPYGSSFEMRGQGGGPAIGFCSGMNESHGWISGDGETWHPLTGDSGFAILPVLVEVTDGMLIKSMDSGDETAPQVPDEFYVIAGPNPFNPQVVVEFGLPIGGMTRIEVYDLRGLQVTTLLNERLDAGRHRVTWQGIDSTGRGVSSGSYFLRITSGTTQNVVRLTLVK